MAAEPTPNPAPEASRSYGDLFLPAPSAEPAAPRQAAPDESKAAMVRLRAPFDIGPVDVVEPAK